MTRTELLTRLRETGASNETLCHVMHVWNEEQARIYTLLEILEAACMCAGCTIGDAKGKVRKLNFVRARHLFFYWVWEHAGNTHGLKEAGKFLNRDHTTVMHGRNKIRGRVSIRDEETLFDLENMRRILVLGRAPNPQSPGRAIVKGRILDTEIVDKHTNETFPTVASLCFYLGYAHTYGLPYINRRYKNRFYRREKKFARTS